MNNEWLKSKKPPYLMSIFKIHKLDGLKKLQSNQGIDQLNVLGLHVYHQIDNFINTNFGLYVVTSSRHYLPLICKMQWTIYVTKNKLLCRGIQRLTQVGLESKPKKISKTEQSYWVKLRNLIGRFQSILDFGSQHKSKEFRNSGIGEFYWSISKFS